MNVDFLEASPFFKGTGTEKIVNTDYIFYRYAKRMDEYSRITAVIFIPKNYRAVKEGVRWRYTFHMKYVGSETEVYVLTYTPDWFQELVQQALEAVNNNEDWRLRFSLLEKKSYIEHYFKF